MCYTAGGRISDAHTCGQLAAAMGAHECIRDAIKFHPDSASLQALAAAAAGNITSAIASLAEKAATEAAEAVVAAALTEAVAAAEAAVAAELRIEKGAAAEVSQTS